MGRIADETIRGAKWGLIQKCTMQPVQFLYGIVLARLITPEEFGILGLTSIFFAIAGQLQNCGFGAALIRKQDRTEEDCSTVFWYNVGASFVLSAALFVAAPWFADFFNQPPLVDITRVSAVMMFLGSTSGVHWALYSARRDFKTPAIVGMITTLVGIPVCLTLAFCGFSYWSMVIQGVVTGLLSLIIIWIISPWKPKFIWSSRSLGLALSSSSPALMISSTFSPDNSLSENFTPLRSWEILIRDFKFLRCLRLLLIVFWEVPYFLFYPRFRTMRKDLLLFLESIFVLIILQIKY